MITFQVRNATLIMRVPMWRLVNQPTAPLSIDRYLTAMMVHWSLEVRQVVTH